MRDYKDVISAAEGNWKSEAQALMQSGVEFVIVHLKPEHYPECSALARQFGYSECLEEDTLTAPAEAAGDKLFQSPTRIGFVKHGLTKPPPASSP